MQLFLTSEVTYVAQDIATHLKKAPSDSTLAFIWTAAETEGGFDRSWLQKNRQALVDLGFNITNCTLTNKSPTDIRKELSLFDIFMVAGGNVFYLLEQMRLSGFDTFIVEQLKQGKSYIGSSAGSIVTGPNIGMTKKLDNHLKAPNLKSYDGLGLVNFVTLPHWGNDYFRELYRTVRMDMAYEEPYPYILLNDNQYILVENDVFKIVDTKQSNH